MPCGIYPQDFQTDQRRWIGGIVQNQKCDANNLHNHELHGTFKICNLVREKISNAVQSNVSLTPTDISQGKGIGFVPSAIDTASAHLGRVAREVSKIKHATDTNDKDWSPCSLESVADDVDKTDLEKGHDSQLDTQYR